MSTLTVFPDANTETTSVDGSALRNSTNQTWSNIRTGNGTFSGDSGTRRSIGDIKAGSVTDTWSTIERGFFLFDTSALTSGASISAATFSFKCSIKADDFGSLQLCLMASAPASNTAIVDADYQSTFGSTEFASRVTIGTLSTSAYTDMPLNASGLAAISKTGITKFGTKAGPDFDNSPPTWASNAGLTCFVFQADQTGTSSDPQLVITYTAGGAAFSQSCNAACASTATIAKGTAPVTKAIACAATATLSRGTGKNLAAACTATVGLVRNTGKSLSAGCAVTSSVAKSTGKLLTVACATTATLVRNTGKALGGTCAAAASIVKAVGKPLAAGCAATGSIVRGVGKSFTATCGATAAITNRAISKTLSAACATTGALSRHIGKAALQASCAATASLGRNIGIRLVAGCSIAATLAARIFTGIFDPYKTLALRFLIPQFSLTWATTQQTAIAWAVPEFSLAWQVQETAIRWDDGPELSLTWKSG